MVALQIRGGFGRLYPHAVVRNFLAPLPVKPEFPQGNVCRARSRRIDGAGRKPGRWKPTMGNATSVRRGACTRKEL